VPRAAVYAALSFLGALAGAALLLGIGKATGWLDSSTKTVVITTQPPPEEQTAVQPQPPPLPASFHPAAIYKKRSPGVVTIFSTFPTGSQGQGSGFVVSTKGYVLTNAHVITTAPDQPIERASTIYVEFSNGDRVDGTIVGYDLFSDVGLVKVDPGAHRLDALPLGESATVVVGEPVAAIGSPFGNENSLSVGVVSGTRRSISSVTSEYELTDAIQTDAAINHGNSGGPLLDGRGRVIGINAQIRSTTGAGEGVGFAVPVDTARRSMRQLLANGEVRYAYVGITTSDLTPALARFLHIPVSTGALVTCVKPHSPGQRAGIHAGTQQLSFEGAQVTGGGDVILAIDGRTVRSGTDVVRLVGQRLDPGQKAVFSILRGSDRKQLTVTLGQRPAQPTEGC
jgi:S1-C subfamily serine protease